MEYLTQEEQRNKLKKKITAWVIGILLVAGLVFGVFELAKRSNVPDGSQIYFVDAVAADDNVLGKKDAPLTLIEYSDFQCPACAAYNPVILQLSKAYPDQLRIVYRHYPLTSIHAYTLPAAYASEAAGKQGKFWEMEELLFTKRGDWVGNDYEKYFLDFAVQLGLNIDQFKKDMASTAVKNKVQQNLQSAEALNLPGTPTFFLNGEKISPSPEFEKFKEVIDQKLAQIINN